MNFRQINIVYPEQSVDNLTFFEGKIPDLQKFVDSTGIRYRFVAPENYCIEDYFCQGIADLNLNLAEIDALITVTQTPSRLIPSLSNYLIQQLELRHSPWTFDLTSGCSGYTEALVLAQQLFQIGKAKNIVICNGDFSTHIVEKENYTIQPLFSDVAAVTWLQPSDGIFEANTRTFGEGYSAIHSEDNWMKMNGLEVFQYSSLYVAKSILELIEKAKKDLNEIDGFYFHQANLIINKTLVRQLELATEKVPSSIEKFGNSSSASIPLTLALSELAKQPNYHFLLSGFGVGFKICNVLLETTNFVTKIRTFGNATI